MIDDLKSCSVCGTRLASKWSKGDLVHYCAYCAVAECSDNAPALRETGALRARAEAAEQRAEAAERELAQARAEGDEAAAAAGAAAAIAKTAQAAAARMRAEAAQARDDRALLAGLWLGAVAPRVLPAILPTDPGDRDRLVAALDAVNLQPSAEACIAAGRAVVARIVAEMGGGAVGGE